MNKSTQAIIKFIDANKQLFIPGSRFNEKIIINFFGIPKPKQTGNHDAIVSSVSRYMCKKSYAQSAINKVLALRGLYIKQHKYTMYKVLTKDEIAADVVAKKRNANKRYENATRLQTSCLSVATPTWKKPTKAELTLLKALGH